MLTKTSQVAEKIVQQISGLELAPGERLPSSHDLAVMHGVSRGTARSALLFLLRGGFVYKRGNRWYV